MVSALTNCTQPANDTQRLPSQVLKEFLENKKTRLDFEDASRQSQAGAHGIGDDEYDAWQRQKTGHVSLSTDLKHNAATVSQEPFMAETVELQLQHGLVTSPFIAPRTPATIAGRKRDRQGTLLSLKRSPQMDLRAHFAGPGAQLGLEELFDTTQAASTSPEANRNRSDHVFDRPSPHLVASDFQSPAFSTSPIAHGNSFTPYRKSPTSGTSAQDTRTWKLKGVSSNDKTKTRQSFDVLEDRPITSLDLSQNSGEVIDCTPPEGGPVLASSGPRFGAVLLSKDVRTESRGLESERPLVVPDLPEEEYSELRRSKPAGGSPFPRETPHVETGVGSYHHRRLDRRSISTSSSHEDSCPDAISSSQEVEVLRTQTRHSSSPLTSRVPRRRQLARAVLASSMNSRTFVSQSQAVTPRRVPIFESMSTMEESSDAIHTSKAIVRHVKKRPGTSSENIPQLESLGLVMIANAANDDTRHGKTSPKLVPSPMAENETDSSCASSDNLKSPKQISSCNLGVEPSQQHYACMGAIVGSSAWTQHSLDIENELDILSEKDKEMALALGCPLDPSVPILPQQLGRVEWQNAKLPQSSVSANGPGPEIPFIEETITHKKVASETLKSDPRLNHTTLDPLKGLIHGGEERSSTQHIPASIGFKGAENSSNSKTTHPRVLAMFRDLKLNYWPATVLSFKGKRLQVQFDDGNIDDNVALTTVRRFDLRRGDPIRLDTVECKGRIFYVYDVKHAVAGNDSTLQVQLLDFHGNNTIVVTEVKPAYHSAVDTEMDFKEYPISRVYLTPSLLKFYADRTFEPGDHSSMPPAGDPAYNLANVRRRPSETLKLEDPTVCTTTRGGLFEGMAFALSISSDTKKSDRERHVLEQRIQAAGGRVLHDGFEDLFEPFTSKASANQIICNENGLQLADPFTTLGFVALISDKHSRREKYVQALALNVPCLSSRWIYDSINKSQLLPWARFLLPAGDSRMLAGAVKSRVFQPALLTTPFPSLREFLAHRPYFLRGKKVLQIAKTAKGLEKRRPYRFLCAAVGACRIGSMTSASITKELFEKHGHWEWVHVDDDEVKQDQDENNSRRRLGQDQLAGTENLSRSSDVYGVPVTLVGDEYMIQTLISGMS